MKLLLFFFFFSDTLHLNYEQAEARFLSQNLGLMAEKMKISEAEARKQQAKLWPNPNFTFDQISVYDPRGPEAVPPLWGSFGRNRQFAMELEQWIRTAGKRKKEQLLLSSALRLEEVSFAEVLWEAKTALRKQLAEAEFLQEEMNLWTQRYLETQSLYERLSAQVEAGNIPKKEKVRLQAYVFELEQTLNSLHYSITESQGHLRKWLNTDAFLKISDPLFKAMPDTSVVDQRPDLRLVRESQVYYAENLKFQQAQKVPDVQLKLQYDRNGSTMLNFLGIGASIELPLWDRKQGYIREAEIGVKKAEYQAQQTLKNAVTEKEVAQRNYARAVLHYERFSPALLQEQREQLENYQKHFLDKSTSMLAYLDYAESSLKFSQHFLEAKKEVRVRQIELQHALGL
jgi:cobalt-zinc-cadmium efflux system outer membrane protein